MPRSMVHELNKYPHPYSLVSVIGAISRLIFCFFFYLLSNSTNI